MFFPSCDGLTFYILPVQTAGLPRSEKSEVRGAKGDAILTIPHSEFRMTRSVDLLTVVLHELGHVLGHDHTDRGVMQGLLPLGTRRVWDDESLLDDADDFGELFQPPDLSPAMVDEYFGITHGK